MNRRGFLKFIGVFAAGTILPGCGSEKIARAPAWAREVMLYRTAAPLVAGNYTFTAYAGGLGMFLGGVHAIGGETLFEIPKTNHPMENPRLKLGGITLETDTDFVDPATRERLIRGEEVRKA